MKKLSKKLMVILLAGAVATGIVQPMQANVTALQIGAGAVEVVSIFSGIQTINHFWDFIAYSIPLRNSSVYTLSLLKVKAELEKSKTEIENLIVFTTQFFRDETEAVNNVLKKTNDDLIEINNTLIENREPSPVLRALLAENEGLLFKRFKFAFKYTGEILLVSHFLRLLEATLKNRIR